MTTSLLLWISCCFFSTERDSLGDKVICSAVVTNEMPDGAVVSHNKINLKNECNFCASIGS